MLLALLSLRNLKISSVPPFPDNNHSPKLYSLGKEGASALPSLKAPASLSRVLGVGQASLVVNRLEARGNR